MLKYQSFFYTFDDLPEKPTAAAVRRVCPEGQRRQHAFSHFRNRDPENIEYLHGYLSAYAKNGVYDESQFQHCFELVDVGLQLTDAKSCHQKLEALRDNLKSLHAEMFEERDTEFEDDTASPWFQFRAGNYEPITARFKELAATVKPRGILGPPEEKEYWDLFQFMILISFSESHAEEAMVQMEKYEQARISVKLTPIPFYDLQETVLGYLASVNITAAVERLQFWLDNSRVQSISDVIKRHPEFAPRCTHLP